MVGRFASPMELSISDEPGCVEGRPEEFILHDLQFLELRVGHVTPDRGTVYHCQSNYRSVDCYFVLCGQLASPPNQRIKFSTNNLSASFRDSEVFYFGFPRDGSVENDDFAGRSVKSPGKENCTALVWIHVDSP
jgi:hypothetical protein